MAEPLRISPPEARRLVETGEAIVLDAVAPQAWEQLDVAVQGAVRIPPDQVEAQIEELPRNRAIIAYCT